MSESPMTAAQDSAVPKKQSIGGDLIIPVGGLFFTIYYFSTIADSPWTAQVSAYFVGAILVLLVGIFIIKSVLQISRGEVDLGLGPLLEDRAFIHKRLILLALTVAYCLFVQYGGFTLTTFAFMALGMTVLTDGANKRFIVALCAVLAVGGWALFIHAFQTRFPNGPFEQLMERLL